MAVTWSNRHRIVVFSSESEIVANSHVQKYLFLGLEYVFDVRPHVHRERGRENTVRVP